MSKKSKANVKQVLKKIDAKDARVNFSRTRLQLDSSGTAYLTTLHRRTRADAYGSDKRSHAYIAPPYSYLTFFNSEGQSFELNLTKDNLPRFNQLIKRLTEVRDNLVSEIGRANELKVKYNVKKL